MVFTMSATAPQFLPEQEKYERATLSPEEIAEIEEDINGIVKFKETEEMKQTGVLGLQKAMEAISNFEKWAYKEACEVAPELVEMESNPVSFLRCERYNAEVRHPTILRTCDSHPPSRYASTRIFSFSSCF
jgi:hypothetical protein